MAYRWHGRVALVTGAASGIGAALARDLASRGCRLALVDRDEEGLRRTAAALGGGEVSLHPLDVTDRAAVAAMAQEVTARHGALDILVNNAGIAAMGRFDEMSLDTFDRVMAVNFGAVVAITKAFLHHLSDDARIVNLSSLFGLAAPPAQVPYVASKFAVRGFTESLRHELRGTGIKVIVVHPGGVRTAIATNAVVADGISSDRETAGKTAFAKFLKLSPERAAAQIVRAIAAGSPRLLIGSDAKAIDWLVRLMPARYYSLVERGMGGMKQHVGRMERAPAAPRVAAERRPAAPSLESVS